MILIPEQRQMIIVSNIGIESIIGKIHIQIFWIPKSASHVMLQTCGLWLRVYSLSMALHILFVCALLLWFVVVLYSPWGNDYCFSQMSSWNCKIKLKLCSSMKGLWFVENDTKWRILNHFCADRWNLPVALWKVRNAWDLSFINSNERNNW